jgi:hypothetical protein
MLVVTHALGFAYHVADRVTGDCRRTKPDEACPWMSTRHDLRPDRNARRQPWARGATTTQPGTWLKHEIPIRTFAEWDDVRPGFLEIDLVAHCGRSTEGFYLCTLCAATSECGPYVRSTPGVGRRRRLPSGPTPTPLMIAALRATSRRSARCRCPTAPGH